MGGGPGRRWPRPWWRWGRARWAVADRVAVPLMVAVGGLMVVRCLRMPAAACAARDRRAGLLAGLDVVVGYQVVVDPDVRRLLALHGLRARGAPLAVFLGLALTSLWFMPLGLLAAQAAGSRRSRSDGAAPRAAAPRARC